MAQEKAKSPAQQKRGDSGKSSRKELVIDAHQHFWEVGRFDYFWMTPDREVLRRDFLPGDLAPLLRNSSVDRSIAIQAHASHSESFWLLELASAHKFIAGVVAWTDLTSSNLGKALDEFQRHPKFKGIRHPLEAEPDDGWVVRPRVLQGLGELEKRGIPFDLVIFPRHLRYVQDVRERCPGLKLVIDHLAKPAISAHSTKAGREMSNGWHSSRLFGASSRDWLQRPTIRIGSARISSPTWIMWWNISATIG